MCSTTTLEMCTGATSSHVNYNGQSESLIDHILLPIEKVDLVSDCSILDDDALNVSNHRPVVCTLNFPLMNVYDNGSGDSSFNINWRNVRGETLANYKEYCLVDESLKCLSHVDVDSKQCVDFLHDGIVSSIRRISEDCIPKSDFKHFLKPYWNKELKAAHKYMNVNGGSGKLMISPVENDFNLILSINQLNVNLENYTVQKKKRPFGLKSKI